MTHLASPTALVVDDDPDAARTLAAQLERLGYRVGGTPASAADALAVVAAGPAEVPQVVLMKAALPGIPDAIAAAAALRRRWLVPTLFVVDEADAATLRRIAVASGAHGTSYLLRPIAERELRVALDLARRPEHAVHAATDLEERFFDVSIDLLCCLGFDGYFRRLNVAWEHALGFSRDELMSRPFLAFVHPEDRERTLAQNRAVRAGGQARSFENRYLCRDGSFRWLRWNATPDPSYAAHGGSHGGSHGVIFSVARDITAQRRAEVEREALVRQLQTALAEVRTLRELLPICSYCRRIRDDEAEWHSVEAYIARHTRTRFSHGICPTCFAREVEPLVGPIA